MDCGHGEVEYRSRDDGRLLGGRILGTWSPKKTPHVSFNGSCDREQATDGGSAGKMSPSASGATASRSRRSPGALTRAASG
jgi:hypothetical protein